MLDTLIIHIPIRKEFVRTTGNLNSVIGDASYYGLPTQSYFKRDLKTGEVTHGELKHPYESLPSSYSGMAIKFFSDNVANTIPYVSMNASVKILQGHNVYGGESVKNLATEMLYLLQSNYPEFFASLDVPQASISRLDSTYSVRLDHERHIQPCLRFLSNISQGQRKSDKDRRDFYNTVYWGGKTSREGGAKAYGKHCEVMTEVTKLKRDIMRGCSQAKNKLSVFTPELLDWSARLLRFESSTKKRKLEKLGLPTNLWQFIEYQQTNKDVLTVLWKLWFNPILQALQGNVEMENFDEAAIYEQCRKHLWSQIIKKSLTQHNVYARYQYFQFDNDTQFKLVGRISYTKANNAFNFYQLLKTNPFSDIKKRYSNNAFHTLIRSLIKVDFTRAELQNLFERQTKPVPMIELINFDFSNQYPADYQPIISEHINAYDYIISKKPKLRLVA
jgi:II/X family phage/plasmid replication protein